MTIQIQTAFQRLPIGKTSFDLPLPRIHTALSPDALEHIRQLLPMSRRAGQILRRHLV